MSESVQPQGAHSNPLMTRLFHIEEQHRKLISKSTLLKVLTFMDSTELETPFLLIDRERVEDRIALIGKNIDNSNVFYAVKANPAIEVLRLLNSMGSGFEIASEGELEMLADLGVEPERIISSNPVKSFRFLRIASEYGVRNFSFDSRDEVIKMAQYVPGSNVYVRLTVPNEGSEWPLSRKFGVEIEEAIELLLFARDHGLIPIGITFHVGSQCTNVHNWDLALYKARMLWDKASENGLNLDMLNIGGGYPIKYTKGVAGVETIERNINKLIKEHFPADTRIYLEPGRAVVGDAGTFVSSVMGKARRQDENWLYIDVGVFNGLMESLGGIRYTYIVEKSGRTSAKKVWTITGPSCDSFDVIDTSVTLPEPEIGARLLILSCGAYTISYASEFNGFSIPHTILI